MDLKVVVTMNLFAEHGTDLLNRRELFNSRRADDAILKPTIGTLDLTLGLGREGMNDIHVEALEELFPVGFRLIGPEVELFPKAIPVLDKSKNPERVHIIA